MQLNINLNSNIQKNLNIIGPLKGEKDPEKQLLYYFKDKKIYIEIFNGNLNASKSFYNILLKYKIIQCKKLSKKIDYIIFKDGHLKTKKYAALNNIKMVNPLWIDDKVNKHIFKDDKEYEIKTNFSDIILREKYEKDKEKEIQNKEKEIFNKNYELELEVEYDTEYANMIDKLRENNSEGNNKSEMSMTTSQISNKYDYNEEVRIKESNKDNDNYNILSINRQKRISSTNSKLENRITINDKNNYLKEFQKSPKKNSKENNNSKNNIKFKEKNNRKEHKKAGKNNKKSKSTDYINSELTKNTHKKSFNNKKNENYGKNYILDLDPNNSKILSLSTEKK